MLAAALASRQATSSHSARLGDAEAHPLHHAHHDKV
jgi:hypothetical protein